MSEYRPGGFQILPPVIKNLLIINVLVFATTFVLKRAGIINLDYYLGLFHWKSPLFEPWQIITHMFMHGDFMHLFFNMFALWMFGNVIENTLGSVRFIIFYLICGLGAAVCHMLVFSWENAAALQLLSSYSEAAQMEAVYTTLSQGYGIAMPLATPMLGASGAIYGLLFAFGYLFPNLMIYVYFLFPLKAKYFVAIFTLLELFAGFRNNPADNVAHFAHLGGMLFAFLLLRTWGISSKNIYRY
jgi:membrane associated rhomboid family serine protease